jgi:hypothetical protein
MPDQWFTGAQVEHIDALAMGPLMDEADEFLSGLKSLRYERADRPPALKGLAPDPGDMRRVEFGCHPADPLKVDERWTEPVHCLICGSRCG